MLLIPHSLEIVPEFPTPGNILREFVCQPLSAVAVAYEYYFRFGFCAAGIIMILRVTQFSVFHRDDEVAAPSDVIIREYDGVGVANFCDNQVRHLYVSFAL